MSNIALPLDKFGNPIQAMTPDTTVTIAISAISATVALPADVAVVRIATPVACHFRFSVGAGTAVATDPLLTTMSCEYIGVPVGATNISVIQEGAVTGTATVTRMS